MHAESGHKIHKQLITQCAAVTAAYIHTHYKMAVKTVLIVGSDPRVTVNSLPAFAENTYSELPWHTDLYVALTKLTNWGQTITETL